MAAVASSIMSGHHLQNQLTRSLERILEEAQLSGELRLSGRKLKDFPNSGDKYNLCDTVIADLSKNRLTELPNELTAFPFLERLQLYHNTIRNIPDAVVALQSLTYLDLSRNQLTTLPKEICQLPLQVLLVSCNKLTTLPDELGRMTELTELDASCNQITHLPHHLGDLVQLRSLILRSNQLLCVSVEVTYLQLVRLDLRENRISSLPVELRLMRSLVDLELDGNPLTSPPASLCKRSRVHIFKYLEMEAMQRNKIRGGSIAGSTSTEVRRSASRRSTGSASSTVPTRNPNTSHLQEGLRHKRHNVDSGYSTSDGFDKRWSQEIQGGAEDLVRKSWNRHQSSPLTVACTDLGSTNSCMSTPSTISPGDTQGSFEDEIDKVGINANQIVQDRLSNNHHSATNSSNELLVNGNGIEDKGRPLNHIQTYREYKEALRQQRNQDLSVYRTRDHTSSTSSIDTKTEPCTPTHQPIVPHTGLATSKSDPTPLHSALSSHPKQIFDDTNSTKRVVQKLHPNRNNSFSPTHQVNGNCAEYNGKGSTNDIYIKPTSPIKNSTGILSHDHIPSGGIMKGTPTKTVASPKLVTTSYINGPASNGNVKNSPKPTRTLTWNQDIPPDKLSFTMRREFDKAREESDLIDQLRSILETRLKMALPDDLAPALADGVVLCHLANHIRPRSVASIHVPSPAVPKLTMARCRRNVDNFLEACRKIGVEENLMCCAADVLEGRGLVQIAITVTELLRFQPTKSPSHAASSMNTNGNSTSSSPATQTPTPVPTVI